MNLSKQGQLYVYAVSAAGLLVLTHCATQVVTNPLETEWLILAALTLLTGSFTIAVPALNARISVSETFVFTSVLLFGTCAGAITVALDALVASLADRERPRRPLRALFNLAGGVVSIWVAGVAFYGLAGPGTFANRPFDLPTLLLPLIVLAALYFALNSSLIAVALAFEKGQRAIGIWRKNFLWLSLSYFGAASVAALLVSYTSTVDLTALGIIVPLLVITYLTSKTSLGRVEDAHRHIQEVNTLYLSTIETLATAIDAKDQVTHGHIRRVQKFALGLAAELGIKDEGQLQAIEAAALLHDTGKLVVPEHILNKPGKLTSGEFEKMKRHASAGAEILSSINFPYPVVPIVRHHHENWDGSGYPDGLRGTEIPIGARILSVVDCFDALTSDRPYRQRLSDEDAMAILMQRRGTMYDPLVVDTFTNAKDKLASALASDQPPLTGDVVRWRRQLIDEADSGRGRIDSRLSEATRDVLESVRQSTRAKLLVLFVCDPSRDQLRPAVCVQGEHPAQLEPIELGTRISGWVATNGQAIVNGDAVLDLPRHAATEGLSFCVAVPITSEGKIVGVLSAYASAPYAFAERDTALVQEAARVIGSAEMRPFIDRAVLDFQHTQPKIH